MPIARVFLGWDRPCLQQAAGWLRGRYPAGDDRRWDLSQVVVVTPGRRAGWRLIEILADAARGLFLPPRLMTQGELADFLCEDATRGVRIAGALEAQLARLQSLRQSPREALGRVLPHPPDDDDLSGWMALAADFQHRRAELAAGNILVGEVVARLSNSGAGGGGGGFVDHDRWAALTALEQAYEVVLGEAGLADGDGMKLRAAREGDCGTEQDVVLLGMLDLSRLVKGMLEPVADRVTALVPAPEGEAALFDRFGCVVPAAWAGREIELDADRVRIVDQPRDQALAVMDAIASPGDGDGPHAADQITVGLGDEAMSPLIERTLELTGIPARAAVERLLVQSRPAMLLAAVGAYIESRRFDDFASLIRHPDVDAHLSQAVGEVGTREGVRHWLTLVDQYAGEHLQRELTDRWLGEDQTRVAMKRLHDAAWALLPEPVQADRAAALALHDWPGHVLALLDRVYGGATLQRFDEADAPLLRALEMLAEALREQAALAECDTLSPRVTFAQAIALLLSSIAGQRIAPEPEQPVVELVGWLELLHDDAAQVIVTGVNEGQIPASQSADMLLPDHVRGVLGLADNAARYARDAAILEVIGRSRAACTLIAGRRGPEGDPLTPSRLLLACDETQLPKRVLDFYGADEEASRLPPRLLMPPGAANRFAVPRPELPDEPLAKLRVTAFRDYLACPYRFYLQHIRRLETIDDAAVEMDGALFGIVAHEVLDRFAKSEQVDCDKPDTLAELLSHTLDDVCLARFGASPAAAVMLQIEQLRRRLGRFALWQAEQVRAGWRIEQRFAERNIRATLDVDGRPFTITGRVDRIDSHPQRGYRVLDYKTTDTAKSPEQVHQAGPRDDKRWVDLQLPLYTVLAGSLGVEGPMALGYVQLPKKLSDVGLSEAQWAATDISDAVETARWVVRQIRAGNFWPPAEDTPDFMEAFDDICMVGMPGAAAGGGA